jgi:VCBS repeat-containing protein
MEFQVVESSILAPDLQQRFPQIRTYVAWNKENSAIAGRIHMTQHGFGAMIQRPGESGMFIDPTVHMDPDHYVVYAKENLARDFGWTCEVIDEGNVYDGTEENPFAPDHGHGGPVAMAWGGNLRNVRLAINATGEYCNFHGSTTASGPAGAVAGITATMNRVNFVYERDAGIRMTITKVGPVDDATQLSPSADGFSNTSGGSLIGQNQTRCDSLWGNAAYDVGHVFSTGGGGVASLGVIGTTGSKARGVTGQGSPTGDPFDIDYVAHELGHQWGCNHSYNGTAGACGGQRNTSTAWEPGSGTTIMSYAGICDTDDVQPNSDAVIHVGSLNELTPVRNRSVGTLVNTGNTAPVITTGTTSFTIPVNTPFRLQASATDANGDTPTYLFEQLNPGAALFRSYNPGSVNYRLFPKLSTIQTGLLTSGFETLPNSARTMNFRLSVRDNRAGGGELETANYTVAVNGTTGMSVSSWNTATNLNAGQSTTVTWTVGSSAANAANVRILFSPNNGTDYPSGSSLIVLNASTPNDGSETVNIPWLTTTQGRLIVEGVNNIFFDMNNVAASVNESNQVGVAVPTQIIGGATGTGTINLTAPAPTGGLVLNLTDNNANVTVPASVTVPAGATSVNFNIVTTNPATNQTAKVTVSKTPWTKDSANFTVRANAAPTAGADSYAVTYQTALNVSAPGVLGNDSDSNGDSITAQIVANGTKGTAVLNANGSFTYTPNAGATGADSFTYRATDGLLLSGITMVSLNISSPQTIGGTITLNNLDVSPAGRQVVVHVRNVGSTTALLTQTVTLDAAGNYSFVPSSALSAGNYDITFQGSHWLRKLNGNVVITAGANSVSASLLNGDVNGDNSVDLLDYFALSDAYGSSVGDPTFNAEADLNGDDSVDLLDYFILSDNYGLEGDE